jgi:SAM-dependent methyltransferase
MTRMADPEQFNADQLAFWNGPGGHTWVARQEHTDITLAPVSEALLALAAPRVGEWVLDIGCGCGATTLEFARAVGPAGRVVALDISAPMLAEGQTRAGPLYHRHIPEREPILCALLCAPGSTDEGPAKSRSIGQAGGGRRSRHSVHPRGAGGASGRRERAPARCDVVGQQRARLSARQIIRVPTASQSNGLGKRNRILYRA